MQMRLRTYDRVIVAAFGAPGCDELAANSPCSVVGIAEAAMAEANIRLDGRFTVVTTPPGLAKSIQAAAAGYGHGQALVPYAPVQATRQS